MATTTGFTGAQFPFRFNGTGGIATSTVTTGDPSHIVESIRQIIGTRQGERVMRPEFGGNADSLVFAPQTDVGLRVANHTIGKQIRRWEKRVELKSIEVADTTSSPAGVAVEIAVEFEITATRQLAAVNTMIHQES